MTTYQFINQQLQNQLIKLMNILEIDYSIENNAISSGEPGEDDSLSSFTKDERLFIDLIHLVLNKRFDSHRSYMVMKNDFKEYLIQNDFDYEEIVDGSYTNCLVETSCLNVEQLKDLDKMAMKS